MENNWPPDSHSDPKEYERSEWAIAGIGVIITVAFGIGSFLQINQGASEFVSVWGEFSQWIGLGPVLSILGAVSVVSISLAFVWLRIITPIHEYIHYRVGEHLGLDPEYGTDKALFMENPCVWAKKKGVTTRENILMLIAPFYVIGIPAFLVMYFSSGLVAGIAAFIFLSNSAGAAQDLYHTFRIMFMPEDALFANIEEGDEMRTEYVLPLDKD